MILSIFDVFKSDHRMSHVEPARTRNGKKSIKCLTITPAVAAAIVAAAATADTEPKPTHEPTRFDDVKA